MTDIVERLRAGPCTVLTQRQAADEIERLRELRATDLELREIDRDEIERLRGMLRTHENIVVCRENYERLRKAATDALDGWLYIRRAHGDLYGVGWDRVQSTLISALAAAINSEGPEPLRIPVRRSDEDTTAMLERHIRKAMQEPDPEQTP